jgi:hypothetical protein
MVGKIKNTILNLEKDGVFIEGEDNLLNHATEYYSDLFGLALDFDIIIEDDIWNGTRPSLSKIDNEELCRPFSEPEIRYTLFQMERNKAAGPDNFSIEFYQAC